MKIHRIPLGFDQCFVLEDRGVIAIDAGAPKKVNAFARGLQRASLRPQDVKLLVVTHGHWDHIGSAHAIKELTHAKLAMHRHEAAWLEQGLKPLPPPITAWGRVIHGLMSAFMPLIKVQPTSVDVLLDSDDVSLHPFGIPGAIIHTPGHSSGSVSVLLETGEVFVGDLAMNALPLRFTPGLPIFAEDRDRLKESWRDLLRRGAKTVFPAHGRPFEADVIEKALSDRTPKPPNTRLHRTRYARR